MHIKINNSGGRYSFCVAEESGDFGGVCFDSASDYPLLPGLKPDYLDYTTAHCFALRLAEIHPEVVRAKKVAVAATICDRERREPDEFFKALEKLADSVPERRPESDGMATIECLRFFAETAAVAVSKVNPRIRINGGFYIPKEDSYAVNLADDGGNVCMMKFDSRLLLRDVVPCGKAISETPYHSREFFEMYFEPILYSIGHLLLPDGTVAIANHPESKRRALVGFSSIDNSGRVVNLSLPEDGDSSWRFSVDTPKKTVVASKQGMVRCKREDLPTYRGRTGTIVEIIDRGSYEEIVVDFGRGLGDVVMADSDVEFLHA